VQCPAKVNLFLAVGPVDGRGYHPLRTVFQAVGLFDEVSIEDGVSSTEVSSDWTELPVRNTLTRTLALLSEIAPVPPLRVHLKKKIPAQSGLGGGSSDAAGLIRGIAKLINMPIPENELMSVALAVGADVPFFLVGGRARAEGYGEKLTPLPDGPREWFVLAKPPVGCSTVEMFGALDRLSYEWRDFPVGDELYNDFERVAPCECLDLIERLQALGARDAGLSGSGSAVFGRFGSEADGLRAAEKLGGEVWVVPSLTRAESLETG
jgi:4-diphosphocytidyl-2-C-methyl-D-erythritol kinase